jgi:hypothetical protein
MYFVDQGPGALEPRPNKTGIQVSGRAIQDLLTSLEVLLHWEDNTLLLQLSSYFQHSCLHLRTLFLLLLLLSVVTLI